MTQSDPRNERIQAYVDGRLSDEARIRFEEELAKDLEVRAEVEALKWLSSTTRGSSTAPVFTRTCDAVASGVGKSP